MTVDMFSIVANAEFPLEFKSNGRIEICMLLQLLRFLNPRYQQGITCPSLLMAV